eukprot:90871-Hanusia_phi.AAC.2
MAGHISDHRIIGCCPRLRQGAARRGPGGGPADSGLVPGDRTADGPGRSAAAGGRSGAGRGPLRPAGPSTVVTRPAGKKLSHTRLAAESRRIAGGVPWQGAANFRSDSDGAA